TSTIDEDALPYEVRESIARPGESRTLSFAIGTPLAEIEMRVIKETLRHTRGDKRLAAKLLGIATRTIYRRLEAEGADTGEGGAEDVEGDIGKGDESIK